MKFLGKKSSRDAPGGDLGKRWAFGAPQAGRRRGLFEMLFGGGIRHDPQGEFSARRRSTSQKAESGRAVGGGVKISSPSYYTYKGR